VNAESRTCLLNALRDRPAAEATSWLRRAEIQIEFARRFAALPIYADKVWSVLVDDAEALLNALDGSGGIESLAEAVEAAERIMAPIGEEARKYRIHCVAHGHIDMNWMWSWPETVATTHDTFASVLSLMDQYPDLTYSQSQASVYALTEKYYPELFERIKQRVREGRWEITAAHWVEGDKNLASGESLCRHILYTRRYIEEKFGIKGTDLPIDWEPDTFGHAATVPTILAQGGVRYYYSCRPGGGFQHAQIGPIRPPLFWWQGPDGSRVLVNRETTWYNSYVNIGDNIALPMADFAGETGLHEWLNVYGVGNHGGGPTRAEIDLYRSMSDWPIYPTVKLGTCLDYFKLVDAEIEARGIELPVLDHELNFEFTGCYTSQSLIKQANRLGENYLVEAEALAAVACRLAGTDYPRGLLREAWINVLFNQFHDILPGSGVRQTREHAMGLFQETGAITGAVKRRSATDLAARINTLSLLPDTPTAREERKLHEAGASNTPFVAGSGIGAGLTGYSQTSGGGRRFLPFVVFNPCAWTRSERVTVALYDTPFEAGRIVAIDDQGRALPTFHLGRGNDWAHDKHTVQFDALDVPAMGYRTYLLCEGTAGPIPAPVQQFDGEWFETPALRFRLDRFRGGISALIDKRTGASLVGDGLLGAWKLVTEQDRGMTAWVLGEEVDAAIPLKVTSFHVLGTRWNEGSTTVSSRDAIGYSAVWNLAVPGTTSTVTLTMRIHGLEPRVEFIADVDWREIGDHRKGIPGLVIDFPLALKDLTSRYEAPFGSVERSLFAGEEVPTLRYAHVSGVTGDDAKYAGATLVQDGKYGHSIDGSRLRLRVIRSSFDPDHAPEVVRQTFRYGLHLHNALPSSAELTQLGSGFNHPFLVVPANLQEGEAATSAGMVSVEGEGAVLTAFKLAEADDSLILRLVELNGADSVATVHLHPEIACNVDAALVVDLMEQLTGETAEWDGETARVTVPANSFKTVKLLPNF
jgi:alpha-mannosidase